MYIPTGEWFYGQWEPGFIKKEEPSIVYLELYAVCVGVVLWAQHFENKRIQMNCDNQSVVTMVNQSTSNCKRCMYLIRMLVLTSMRYNCWVFVKYLKSKDNF